MPKVAVFSDSQLRPVVEGSVDVPINWYVNCTPGGCLLDVAVELAECKIKPIPKFVIIAAGTNDMARHFLPKRLDAACGGLIQTAKKRFPDSKVSTFT